MATNSNTSLTEAREYALRLVQILPSPESFLRVARLSMELGDLQDALRLIEDTRAEGYVTRESILRQAKLLTDLGRLNEATSVLADAIQKYPEDYDVAFNLGAAWARLSETEKAIEVWEGLLKRSEVRVALLTNLARLYMLRASSDPNFGNRAFDLLKKAFELDPSEPTLPALLVSAAQVTGRGKEAWALIARVDLHQNPYLRPIPVAEAVPIIRQLDEKLRATQKLHDAGIIPFASFMQQAPRPAWYLWWSRMSLSREALEQSKRIVDPYLFSLPSVRKTLGSLDLPRSGLILDSTALLTLGCLGIIREVVDALNSLECPVYLFPGAMEWLGNEVTQLQADQLPWYRGRYIELVKLLRQARDTVEIIEKPTPGEGQLHEDARSKIGHASFDINEAFKSKAYYVDDYVESVHEALLSGLLVRSAELSASLVANGLLLPSTVKNVEADYPRPFTEWPTKIFPVDRPVMFSEHSLLAWHEAGLLQQWIEGGARWPKVIVGPFAWSSISSSAREAIFYQESLKRAMTAHVTMREYWKMGRVKEATQRSTLDLVPTEFREVWGPTIKLMQIAKDQNLVLWADDLFTHMIVDPRGLLSADHQFRIIEGPIQNAFGELSVSNTEEVLRWIQERDRLSEDREGELIWSLFSHGYRVLTFRAAIRWLLRTVPYLPDSPANPYRDFLRDIAQANRWIPETVPEPRRSLFVRTTIVSIIPPLIAEAWNSSLDEPARKHLAESLLSLSEGILEGLERER